MEGSSTNPIVIEDYIGGTSYKPIELDMDSHGHAFNKQVKRHKKKPYDCPSTVKRAGREKTTKTCPICLDSLAQRSIISMPCNHLFCAPCIKEWISTKERTHEDIRCPLCRKQVFTHILCRIKQSIRKSMVDLIKETP